AAYASLSSNGIFDIARRTHYLRRRSEKPERDPGHLHPRIYFVVLNCPCGGAVHARPLRLCSRRSPGFCSLKHHLQTVASIFSSRGNFLNPRKSLRNVRFLTNLLQERLQFRKNKPHFPTAVPEKFFIYGATQHKRRSHVPITVHLS